jgi:hypothetical protein
MSGHNLACSKPLQSASMKESRIRARVVCTRCHERKVRCDLGEKTNGTACQNCQREQCPCQFSLIPSPYSYVTFLTLVVRKHLGIRKRRLARSPVSTATCTADAPGRRQKQNSRPTEHLLPERAPTASRSDYFGTQSVLSVSDSTPLPSHDPTMHPHQAEVILSVTDATLLPSETYRKALQEIYVQHLYPIVPVLDQDESSLLLQQTMCFAGSVMRRPNDHLKNFAPEDIYARIKVLLFLGVENDILSVLKAYCVLACWTPLSSHLATLDHPWHWAGVALRLAIQLGLHKESTHLMSPKPTESRNIWWYLFVSLKEWNGSQVLTDTV